MSEKGKKEEAWPKAACAAQTQSLRWELTEPDPSHPPEGGGVRGPVGAVWGGACGCTLAMARAGQLLGKLKPQWAL